MTDTATLSLVDLVQTWQDKPAGEDPRYSESFAQLRAEVEKLAGNDFPRIREQGEKLLSEQALDMRVLAYTSLACTYLEGARGLADALDAWCWLIQHAWIGATVSCHPARENGRVSAITWLQQERLATYLSGQPSDASELAALSEKLDQFHSLLAEKLPEPIRLKAVERWLDNQKQNAQPSQAVASQPQAESKSQPATRETEVSTSTPTSTPTPPASQPPAAPTSGADLVIKSEQQEEKALRDLLAWYRQERRFEPMVRLSRTLRWSGLVIPPAEGNQTRVPAPRAASLNAIQHAASQGDAGEVLLAAEKAFLEPGGQYCLLIQKAAADAATALGQAALAALIQRETVALVERLRGLMALQFADGSPFVEGDTRNWLEGLLSSTTESHGEEASRWAEVALEAGVVCNQSGLADGLKVIDAMATRGRRERTEQDLLKAELCLANQRSELAVPLLEAVAERLDDHGIAAWEPGFAVRVWRLLQQALRARGDGADIQHRLDQISHYISRTDIRAAAAIL